jgi:hypothetical protein
MNTFIARGWQGQVKKNGTCSVIFSRGDEITFQTRHNEPHKLWTPLPGHLDLFRGRSGWNVYVAELLHSKTPHIKNHLYLFDILVSDGADLAGMTLAYRYELLRSRFQRGPERTLGALEVNDLASVVLPYEGAKIRQLWANLRPEDEGIVFKNPAATLAACVTPTSNAAWQVKCRRATKNYSF